MITCSDTEAVAFGGLGASVDVKLLSQVLIHKTSSEIICKQLRSKICALCVENTDHAMEIVLDPKFNEFKGT